MNVRFLKHKQILSKIQNILPSKIINFDETQINETIDTILTQWPNVINTSDNICKKESLLWKQKWLNREELPRSFIDSLNYCDDSVFPNIHNILKLCATLPVTVATPERSFSTLKRIKTNIRNSTGEDRLNGLATLSIHREIKIGPEEVIDKFAQKNRKMLL